MLEATSGKGFDAVLANFLGPCLRQMQKSNKKFREEAFIVEVYYVLEERLHSSFDNSTSSINNVAFSVSIDATRVSNA